MATELDAQRTISSDDECYDALAGLWVGDLEPLGQYLAKGTGTLHPLVQRELAKMIRDPKATWKIRARYSKRGRPKGANAERDKLLIEELSKPLHGSRTEAKYRAASIAAEATGAPVSREVGWARNVELIMQAGRKKRERLLRFMRAQSLLRDL